MATQKIFVLICGLCLGMGVLAQSLTLNPDHPQEYTVVEGDTLWGIAARFLKSPWYWPELWHANPQVENPHLIYPGDVLRLTYVDGKPTLALTRGRPTVKLSPHVRVSPITRAIPAIPIDAIQPFLTRPRVLTKEQIIQSPYVVAPGGEHLAASHNQKIYVIGLKAGDPVQYEVFRPGQVYLDYGEDEEVPGFLEDIRDKVVWTVNSKEEVQTAPVVPESDILGYEAFYLGNARVEQFGEPSTLLLGNANREVSPGDRLLPFEKDTYEYQYLPRAPTQPINGYIIAVLDGVQQIGQYNVVVLNRGQRHGLEVGHVLAIYQSGRTVIDHVAGGQAANYFAPGFRRKVALPDERAGELMVFRVFDRVSFALVMRATKAIHVYDRVTNP